ncbi:flagellar filament capping protein FliD [Paludibacterium paludis]|uniref:Flagellar hook-associated protein 2 n=1 Tax=Paludibacterium paludis TaxID=1225769 RepID=A0A918P6H7_9NEIS|nr:flagellar filament capping protein FliD [Paludibacterium paludis]GGY25721.1 flagellar hook-associated protein 2 [Paludibacterium paludis]
MPSITSQVGQLDVQGLVSQLMTVERQPLDALKKKTSTYQSQLSDLGKLKSDLSALQSSMRELASGTFLNAAKFTSSSTEVLTGTTNNFALAGVYNIEVTQIAKGQNVAFANMGARDAKLGNAADELVFTFQDGTSPAKIAIKADSSLQDIAAAVNGAGAGINATIVNSGDPANPSKLVFTSTKTGNGKAFTTTLTNDDAKLQFMKFDPSVANDPRMTSKAQDAIVKVNGVEMHNATNTLTEGITGVTLNISKTGTSNVTVARDDEAIQKKLQDFVDAYNKVRSTAESLRKGSMRGNAAMLSVKEALSGVLSAPIGGVDPTKGLAYLAQIGITSNGTTKQADGSTQLDGSLKFDAKIFKEALDKDVGAVARVLGNTAGDGVADRLNKRVNELLNPDGVLETATSSVTRRSQDDKIKQDRLEARMAIIEKRYLTQFSSLNTALTRIAKTSDYLSRTLR